MSVYSTNQINAVEIHLAQRTLLSIEMKETESEQRNYCLLSFLKS